MIEREDLSKFGIGTWGIGGFMERDYSVDEQKQVEAIAYMLDHDINFAEANMWYSEGYSVEILAKALDQSSKNREDLFICQTIYLMANKGFQESKKELDQALELFNTDYIDILQFSMGSFLLSSFEEITEWVDGLLASGVIRYTGITNENFDLLKRYHEKYIEKLFSHEVVYNFEVRANEELGIIPYANEHNILTIAYQPLRRNRTALQNWEPVKEISEKYSVSQNQVLLSWIISKGYLPITKSESIDHIKKHIKASELMLDEVDIAKLENYVIPDYKEPEVDWYKTGEGVSIDKLSNVFDERYNV